MRVLLEQLDTLAKTHDVRDIDVFGSGPNAKCHSELVLAIALAGQEIMMYMIEDPDLVHGLLKKIQEMNIRLIEFFADRQGRHIEQIFISDCTGVMLSHDLWEVFGLPRKNQLLDAFDADCALHGCGIVNHLLSLYPTLSKFSWLEAGYGTDVGKLLAMLDGAGIGRADFLLEPAHLKETSARTLRGELQSLIEGVSPRALRLRTGPMEYGTPLENIGALYDVIRHESDSPVGQWAEARENY